ncbi:zinc ribbon domain-containing protein [uncultured Methanobrevibacter sp.]|uniref:zinc ribbon domain-containing protein n=1 Tax=uncultured Methanobrevibacter sp. TaxID=253161 RepID=UPI00262DDB01|nr:zinc ribbon domain-containing protein [uncultured Methanobrevibacter sp.]
MKCNNCGFENKNTAKFCTKCGASLNDVAVPETKVQNSNSTKYAIIALVIVIIILVACLGYFMGTMNSNDSAQSGDSSQNSSSSKSVQSDDDSSGDEETTTVSSSQSSSTKATESKSWVSIGSYSGSGSGSQTIEVPSGEIMVKLSAYPIKNYATNHLYVTGSNGQSGGVDWGSHSDVETRSDSFSYTSSSSETFTIDYYETVSWEVEFYKYQ